MSQLAAGGYAHIVAGRNQSRCRSADPDALNTGLSSGAGSGGDFAARMLALYENEKFWRQIAVDLAGDGNRLPDGLRASMISIAGFVISHSAKIRAGQASVQPLLDINLSIIRGLRAGDRAA